MGKKELEKKIAELEQERSDFLDDYSNLSREYYQLSNRLYEENQRTEQAEIKREYAGSIAFDFWPPSDWFRLGLDKWQGGRYFQLTIGPIRLDFYES